MARVKSSTVRESGLVDMVQNGMTTKEITASLFLSASTVEIRWGKHFKKTRETNRQQLAAYFNTRISSTGR